MTDELKLHCPCCGAEPVHQGLMPDEWPLNPDHPLIRATPPAVAPGEQLSALIKVTREFAATWAAKDGFVSEHFTRCADAIAALAAQPSASLVGDDIDQELIDAAKAFLTHKNSKRARRLNAAVERVEARRAQRGTGAGV